MVKRIARVLCALAVVTLPLVAAGCARTVSGLAVAGSAGPATTTAPVSGTGTPPPTSTGTSGDLSQKARQVCADLPKSAAGNSFGLPDVTITAEDGQTLKGGILQVKCVVTSTVGFHANVVVQIYPSTVLASADEYLQLMRQQFGSVQQLSGINGADVAGVLKDTQTGTVVDEAFAAKKDPAANTVDVVIAGVADTPGIQPKLVAFITALASP